MSSDFSFSLAVYESGINWCWFIIKCDFVYAQFRLHMDKDGFIELLKKLDSPNLYPSKESSLVFTCGNQTRRVQNTQAELESCIKLVCKIKNYKYTVPSCFNWLESFLNFYSGEKSDCFCEAYGVEFYASIIDSTSTANNNNTIEYSIFDSLNMCVDCFLTSIPNVTLNQVLEFIDIAQYPQVRSLSKFFKKYVKPSIHYRPVYMFIALSDDLHSLMWAALGLESFKLMTSKLHTIEIDIPNINPVLVKPFLKPTKVITTYDSLYLVPSLFKGFTKLTVKMPHLYASGIDVRKLVAIFDSITADIKVLHITSVHKRDDIKDIGVPKTFKSFINLLMEPIYPQTSKPPREGLESLIMPDIFRPQSCDDFQFLNEIFPDLIYLEVYNNEKITRTNKSVEWDITTEEVLVQILTKKRKQVNSIDYKCPFGVINCCNWCSVYVSQGIMIKGTFWCFDCAIEHNVVKPEADKKPKVNDNSNPYY